MYYAIALDTKMLMAMNYLEVVQTKTTIETEKQTTRFSNIRALHLDTVIEYRKGKIIIHIYSGTSYI